MNLLYFFGITILSVFLFEHIGRVNNFLYRPTYAIDSLYEICKTLFTKLGIIFAQLSSWLYQLKEILYLQLEELFITSQELFTSLLSLLITPFYFTKGYLDTVMTYLADGYLIYFGSMVLIIIVALLVINRQKIRIYFTNK